MFTDDRFTFISPPIGDLQRNIYSRDNSNHSTIVKKKTKHTIDYLPVKSLRTFGIKNSIERLETFGVFHNYPNGIVNPAFTGIMLWKICYNHDLNDYQICEYHNIKSGIILYGTEAYVFTQITNNDIMSYVKILFRHSNLLHNLKPTVAAKMIVK